MDYLTNLMEALDALKWPLLIGLLLCALAFVAGTFTDIFSGPACDLEVKR